MRCAAERTHRRLASMGAVAAPVHWATQEYIAEYLIGEPPRKAEGVIDSGSNLVWTQCATCRPGFNQTLSYYNYSQSRTFRAVSCSDAACALGPETECTRDGESCGVNSGYGSCAITGVFGTEVFTFGPSEKVSIAFGCVAATQFTPPAGTSLYGASGIIGLGRGNLSLVSQVGDTRFSSCLTRQSRDAIDDTSHLFVGASADLRGSAPVTSVPLVKNPTEYPFSSFYYLPLVGLTVGKSKLAVPVDAFQLRQVAQGMWAGTFMDSGTTSTYLVDVAYRALRDELARQLGASLVQPSAAIAAGIVLDLCVAKADFSRLVAPLVLHFSGGDGSRGGDMVLPPGNYWATLDKVSCMMVFSSAGQNFPLPLNESTVIGNVMQQDMHLLFDLANGVLSFQKADCSSI